MRKWIIIALLATFGLSACNTIKGFFHGFGKDTQRTGEWIQEKTE